MSSSAPESRRSRRIAERRGRHVRRLRSLATATALLTASTLIGIAAAGGTYALLNDKATMKGATVTSGNLQLLINNAQAANLGNFTITPARAQAKSFVITNTGDVNVNLSAAATNTSAQALVANTRIRVTPVASAAACQPGLSGQQAPLASYTNSNLGSLNKGTTGFFCLELSLAPGTPVEQSGQQFSFTLTVNGAQKAG